jgi:hypothetical protein
MAPALLGLPLGSQTLWGSAGLFGALIFYGDPDPALPLVDRVRRNVLHVRRAARALNPARRGGGP